MPQKSSTKKLSYPIFGLLAPSILRIPAQRLPEASILRIFILSQREPS